MMQFQTYNIIQQGEGKSLKITLRQLLPVWFHPCVSFHLLIVQGHGAAVQFTDMQAHSLKPSGGTDMQFNITENQIRGFGDAEGHCVAARHLHVSFSLSSQCYNSTYQLSWDNFFLHKTEACMKCGNNLFDP